MNVPLERRDINLSNDGVPKKVSAMLATAFLQSFGILVREGVEAMLIISALAAYLKRNGAHAHLHRLYAGAMVAVALSLGLAVVFALYFGGAHNDTMEAVTMFVAAALMLYMSGWMFLRQDPKRLHQELQAKATGALQAATPWALTGVAFFAVLREGAETILFIHAAATEAGGYTAGIVSGLGAATVVLGGVFVAMQVMAQKLPLRAMFVATSALLFGMSLQFIYAGIHELQEIMFLPYTEITGLPDTTWEQVAALVLPLAAAAYTVLTRSPWRAKRAGA